MNKLVAYSVLAIALVGGGGWYAKHLAAQALGKQVVTIVDSPTAQQEINKIVKHQSQQQIHQTLSNIEKQAASKIPSVKVGSQPVLQNSTTGNQTAGAVNSGTGSDEGSIGGNAPSSAPVSSSGTPSPSSGDTPTFSSRQQVIDYAMSHFTAQEIAHYMYLYLHRSTLTSLQKDAIKQQILSHFTPAQIAAMAAAAKKYSS
ncbi:hypothetical protein LLE49_19030 [Alicyclobacillus tolerans]|uniref:hypothetical protein n=1 Tax=Alicyclobacillus tolerans TaxID=90970 RepID=UPI001F4228F8|nr:hypothetical protein [Alicyclobacillus tolerans]MCF8566819.1 hypothetical protein [Alicyclobacillus tolerans]